MVHSSLQHHSLCKLLQIDYKTMSREFAAWLQPICNINSSDNNPTAHSCPPALCQNPCDSTSISTACVLSHVTGMASSSCTIHAICCFSCSLCCETKPTKYGLQAACASRCRLPANCTCSDEALWHAALSLACVCSCHASEALLP